MLIYSTFADFIIFLYVHISQADNSYDPAEMAAIKSKMKTLYPADTDIEKKLYGTIREYNSFNKEQLNELLQANAKHFSQDKSMEQYNIFDSMTEIIRADGRVEQSETNVLESLKELIAVNR